MSITITNESQFGSNADYSGSFDVNGGKTLIVAVYTDQSSGRLVTGVTYNGISMTEIFNQTLHYRIDRDVDFHWYKLDNPASGSNTLAVTTNNANLVFDVQGWVCALSDQLNLEGTDYHTIQGDIVGSDTTTDLSIAQVSNGNSIALLYGANTPNGAGTNYHTPGTGYTEVFDSQTVLGEANVGKYVMYRVDTSGSGTKTIDNGSNNFDLPGPGSPRTWFETAILLSKEGGTGNFFKFFRQ